MLFFFLFSLLLFIAAAQGDAFQGLTHLPASPPQPQHPCAAAQGRGPPPLPAFAWTDRGVGPGCSRDGQRGTGGAALRGLHARTGKCCAAGSDMQRPESRAGGLCCKVAARGVGGDRSLPAASWEKCRAGTGARAQGPKHIHLRDPVDERLLPGRDIAAVLRVLGAGELWVKCNRERR